MTRARSLLLSLLAWAALLIGIASALGIDYLAMAPERPWRSLAAFCIATFLVAQGRVWVTSMATTTGPGAGPPATADTDWKNIIADAANGCSNLATFHDDKSRRFFSVGLATALVGLMFYIWSLTTMTRNEQAASVGSAMHSLQAMLGSRGPIETSDSDRTPYYALGRGSFMNDGPAANPIERLVSLLKRYPHPDVPELQDLLTESASYIASRTKSNDQLVEFERTQNAGIVSALHSIADAPNKGFSVERDMIPILRNSLAFLFIEVLAGFFFGLAQRNDVQASLWRSHRQIYERFLAVPGLIASTTSHLNSKITAKDLVHLLAPTPIVIVSNKGQINPTADGMRIVASAIRRGRAPESKGTPED